MENESLPAESRGGFGIGVGTDKAVVNVVKHNCECLENGYLGVGGTKLS